MRTVIVALVIFLLTPLIASTPEASPAASPIAANGCDRLGAYFQALADLVLANDGMQLIPGSASSIASLSEEERVRVAAALTELLPALQQIEPPAPAVRYHVAYISLITWYRDLAGADDPASWQRLINNDRQVARDMGQGTFFGQATCGAAVWDNAREAAFPS